MTKQKKSSNLQLVNTLLLNRILQTQKSPARKTHGEISKKLNTTIERVRRAEQIITEKLRGKVSVLEILTEIK